MRTGTIRIVAGGAGKSVPPVLYHIGKTPMDKDMENPWLGVETGCAEAGERAGVARDFRLLSQRTAKPSADAKMRVSRENARRGRSFSVGVALSSKVLLRCAHRGCGKRGEECRRERR